ncbi:hypothetical protein [Sediminicoccus rosea]|uniref:Uncharacterized protein n=1 Tax=Sediminicoccus rosea TaxID=1225128 RepID=A0ABZ0PDG7_9PROT|nr:hypothetical protein [Sediminicoccus rosea]WPB83749.1 hypothetical protein R9Z33_16730 [Sediminicoccus rosea]
MTQGVRFEPTDEQRRTVRGMAGYGMPHVDIATFLDIDAKTLRKHFTRELDLGSIEATTKVAQSLFRMATEGKNVAAAIFWMKARAGWREKQPEALMEDDKPITATVSIVRTIIDPMDPQAPPQVIEEERLPFEIPRRSVKNP